MITYKAVESENELRQILSLQKKNLIENLSKEQIDSQGFVTVNHDFETLAKMNNLEKSIIAKDLAKDLAQDEGAVIGYLLAMRPELRNDIPVLVPMFNIFDKLEYKNRKLSEYNYIVVGQVCIADGYRGKGILDESYAEYKSQLSGKYDFAITEIITENQRSINAHKRIGFELLHNYTSPDKRNWDIVLWDWKK